MTKKIFDKILGKSPLLPSQYNVLFDLSKLGELHVKNLLVNMQGLKLKIF